MISDCNIRNYSIYFIDDLLFSYFEYHGADFKAEMAKMPADPTTQEWWAVIKPCTNHWRHEKSANGGRIWKKHSIWTESEQRFFDGRSHGRTERIN